MPHVELVGISLDSIRLLWSRLLISELYLVHFENIVYCQFECVVQHSWQKHFQKLGALLQTWIRVGFNEPCVELRVDDEIVAKDLEALASLVGVELSLDGFQR